MNYLIQEILENASCLSVLMYIKSRDGLKKDFAWSNRQWERDDIQKFITSGDVNDLNQEEKEGIKKLIIQRIRAEHIEENADRIINTSAVNITADKIESEREKANITKHELCGMLNINLNTYYHMYKTGFPLGVSEFIYKVIIAVMKRKKREMPNEINLMKTRVAAGLSVEEAAKKFGIHPAELWAYEYLNCLPIHLIEPVSNIYKIRQETIPLTEKEMENFGQILSLKRKELGITLKEMSLRTGYSEGRCSLFESSKRIVPPYEYIKEMLRGTGLTVESVLLDAAKLDIKFVSIPLDTVEYYRKLYYNNERTDRNKKKKKSQSRKTFEREIGISSKAYASGIWTAKQAKNAVKLLGNNVSIADLIRPLTVKQERILECRVKYKKLRDTRIKKKKSISTVSTITGIGYSTIASIEVGEIKCSATNLKRLAECYGYKVTDFAD